MNQEIDLIANILDSIKSAIDVEHMKNEEDKKEHT